MKLTTLIVAFSLLATVVQATVVPTSTINTAPQPSNMRSHLQALDMLGESFTITAFICSSRNVASEIIERGKTAKEFMRRLNENRCVPRLGFYRLVDTLAHRQALFAGIQETWFALVLRDEEGRILHGIMGVRD